MDFHGEKPIYLQIADVFCEGILSGSLKADDRIPSVREYGADIGVNPNTVMRVYEKLTAEGIIYNKRGIGYFVSQDARDKILDTQRAELLLLQHLVVMICQQQELKLSPFLTLKVV